MDIGIEVVCRCPRFGAPTWSCFRFGCFMTWGWLAMSPRAACVSIGLRCGHRLARDSTTDLCIIGSNLIEEDGRIVSAVIGFGGRNWLDMLVGLGNSEFSAAIGLRGKRDFAVNVFLSACCSPRDTRVCQYCLFY